MTKSFICDIIFIWKSKKDGIWPFLELIAVDNIIRKYIGKWIIGFTVQLEVLIEDTWSPVIRYDTSHGFFHRDYIHPDGITEKTIINVKDFKEALTFSENDIKVNWEFYRVKFLQEVKNG